MFSIKAYLAVVTFLLVVAISFTGYVWYKYQSQQTLIEELQPASKVTSPTEEVVPEHVSKQGNVSPKTTSPKEESPQVTATTPVVIQRNTLSETQQKILSVFGFDAETYTITPEMIMCAKNAVGKERLDEIINGSAPSPIEAAKLTPCFT